MSPRRFKWLLNCYPPYIGAGVRVKHVSDDFDEMLIELKVRWFNRNFFGTHFGGSLYSMIDPHLCLLLTQHLGRDYFVWDQAAEIEFVRASKNPVQCLVKITDEDVETIKRKTQNGDKYLPEYKLEICDHEGIVAKVNKVIYIRRKKGSEN